LDKLILNFSPDILFTINISSLPSCKVQLPLVPSTIFPSVFASLDKCKSPVYKFLHTLPDAPKSYVSFAPGTIFPVAVIAPEVTEVIAPAVISPKSVEISTILVPSEYKIL
jgi:hypothetical protein